MILQKNRSIIKLNELIQTISFASNRISDKVSYPTDIYTYFVGSLNCTFPI
ncbi:hypothetical protein IMPERIA89_60113 [Imperialibacter sp. 89]|nr:hypothetical protein IMPERIA89_60113 [Imperialibacter sp. 89]